MINKIGKCFCGCGKETTIAIRNCKKYGWIKGEYHRFCKGHRKSLRTQYVIDRNNCWVWLLSTPKKRGYGRITVFGKPQDAHRYYYEKNKGKVPKGMQLDHLCRNRNCVNPDHLQPVTCAENIRRGLSTKITKSKAIEIRKLYLTGKYLQRELGQKFGLFQTTISAIITNKNWRNI